MTTLTAVPWFHSFSSFNSQSHKLLLRTEHDSPKDFGFNTSSRIEVIIYHGG